MSDISDRITAELQEIREQAGKHTIEDIREGTWFDLLLRSSLIPYREQVDLEYFHTTYPDLPRLAVASNRIEMAKRFSALEGRVASSAYTPVVASALGSRSDATSGPVPDDAMAFVADLLYTTRLQLRLAHDLCVIHDRALDLDDPGDLYDLVRIAFGLRAGQLLFESVETMVRDLADGGIQSTTPGAGEAVKKSLPVLGSHLLRRNVIKYIIPYVSVPLNAALDYYFTADVAHTAGNVLAEKATDPEVHRSLASLSATSPKVLLEAIWLIIISDEKITEGEKKFINNLTLKLTEIEGGEETIQIMKNLEGVDEEAVLARVSEESDEVKKILYEVVCDAAAIDHKIHRKEKKIVQRFAQVCGATYDVKDLKQRAKKMKG